MGIAQIRYFDKPGAANTDALIEAVNERLKAGDIKQVVVATNTGATALRAAELITVPDVRIFGVHHQSAQWGRHAKPDPDKLAKACELGVTFIPDSPPVTYFRQIQGESADTLRHLGQGVKVATEVVLMAAQTRLIEPGSLVIGVGGTGRGADAAIVCTAAIPTEIGKLFIREVLAKPIVPG
jgi:hypothetical protein